MVSLQQIVLSTYRWVLPVVLVGCTILKSTYLSFIYLVFFVAIVLVQPSPYLTRSSKRTLSHHTKITNQTLITTLRNAFNDSTGTVNPVQWFHSLDRSNTRMFSIARHASIHRYSGHLSSLSSRVLLVMTTLS
jgi:hypothetical protein